MITIEIYERVPYDPRFHRWMCKWSSSAWFFTDDKQYNTTFGNPLNTENHAKEYSHLADTFVTPTTPQNHKDLSFIIRTRMPELFI